MRDSQIGKVDLSALLVAHLDRILNQGELSAVDELLSRDVVAPQEDISGTAYREHLKQLVATLRTAFVDLHFEFEETVASGDTVVCRSTMTGRHVEQFMGVEASGARVSIVHVHFVHFGSGRGREVWHLWDIPALMKQMGGALGQHT